MSIASSAVFVELNISVWPASKIDKDSTAKVNSDAVAVRDAAQVKKNLFAGTSLRKDIEKFAARIRLYHSVYTLPWADKGKRLLPSKLFLDYKKDMDGYKNTFNALCETFYAEYPALVANAATNLGSLYRAGDYPTLDEVKDKFGFSLSMDPIPESGDFRLDVGNAELSDLKKEYEEKMEQRIAEATRSAWDRLHGVLTHMSEKLTNPQTEDGESVKEKRYHDTLITNAQELCGLLSKLNITNDSALEAARKQLESVLLTTDIQTVKDSQEARVDLKQKVDNILRKFEW